MKLSLHNDIWYNRIKSFGLALILTGTTLTVHAQSAGNKQSNPAMLTQFVDPYIGTGFHGHVFVGANVPMGAVQLGPVNISEGWDWCSGYHYSDSTIVGFSHTHLSGTGIGDLGDISVMPTTGEVKIQKGVLNQPESGYYSLFSHADETVRPGYYAVKLKRYQIKAELSASERVGFHQYTFPAAADGKLIFDLKEGIGWDKSTETVIRQVNDTTLSGYRYSQGWANDQRIYFTAVFSKPMKSFSLHDGKGSSIKEGTKGEQLKGVAHFSTRQDEQILLKVGISPVSEANAAANILAEIPGWNFRQVVQQADEAWNKELNKISIETIDPASMRVFYTALYHTLIAPSLFNDANGQYRGTDKKVYDKPGFNNLTTFSLWDTYRAAHPLFTLVQPEKVNDMVNTMLAIYQQQGKLPIWHLMGNETNTMVGNPAISVISDAILKGFKGFDQDLAYEAMKKSAMLDERGLAFVKKNGFIPADSVVESVAMGMEYAIADGSLARVAHLRKNKTDFDYFHKRSLNYQHYFDPETRFVRGKLSAKQWRTPFNPFESVHMKNDFTEGNAWQYLWLVPHDVEGLISLLGGKKPFLAKLDSLFVAEGDMGKNASPDISGLIGQYAHGNEPSHHIPYLYAFAGQPWKTAEKVRYIMSHLYTDQHDGLCGNEDVGQMSAWYVFSALGFYPVNPAAGVYVFGSPIVNQAKLDVGNNRFFQLKVKNNGADRPYIQGITLNGKPYSKSYIRHQDIVAGGEMLIEMGDKPAANWAVQAKDYPGSSIN